MHIHDEETDFIERREGERRTEGRRRYNRRQGDTPVAPPYFAVFERIAVALERIARSVDDQPVVLPSEPEDDA